MSLPKGLSKAAMNPAGGNQVVISDQLIQKAGTDGEVVLRELEWQLDSPGLSTRLLSSSPEGWRRSQQGQLPWGWAGYLAAKSDGEHYASEREIERREVETIPAKEIMEVE